MLERLASQELRALAEKAGAVREVRDRMLTSVRDGTFGEDRPGRGEHNPTAGLGLDTVPEDHSARRAFEDALSALPPPALRELWAAVLIGRGDYGVKDWDRALEEANRLTGVNAALFLGLADLHEYMMKAVYELERA